MAGILTSLSRLLLHQFIEDFVNELRRLGAAENLANSTTSSMTTLAGVSVKCIS